jgi:hypothetical protein
MFFKINCCIKLYTLQISLKISTDISHPDAMSEPTWFWLHYFILLFVQEINSIFINIMVQKTYSNNDVPAIK